MDRLFAHPWLESLQRGGSAAEAAEAAAFADAVRAADGAKQQMRQDLENEKEWSREEYVEAPVRKPSSLPGSPEHVGRGGGPVAAAVVHVLK